MTHTTQQKLTAEDANKLWDNLRESLLAENRNNVYTAIDDVLADSPSRWWTHSQ